LTRGATKDRGKKGGFAGAQTANGAKTAVQRKKY